MCTSELAMNTSTAATRIGSQSEASDTIGTSAGEDNLSRRGGGGLSGAARHLVRRVPRQRLIPHREVIHGGRDDDRRLLHVVFNDAFVGIKVGVPGVRLVLNRILCEADAGEARP